MNDISRKILSDYQIRKTKKQKTSFLEYLSGITKDLGYKYSIEPDKLKIRNFIVGDVEKAKVICTAHYDTCARLPFPNIATPKNIGIYILYQLSLIIAVLVAFFISTFSLAFFAGLLANYFGGDYSAAVDLVLDLSDFILFFFCIMLIIGPANKSNANDNTSGVTVLTDLMQQLTEEEREKVAFVFFDLEEAGLIGSLLFKRKYKEKLKDKIMLNFDCVSDGDNIMFCLGKDAEKYKREIENSYIENGTYSVLIETENVFYPSDHMHFSNGIGVAALNKTKRGILYCNKIHTKKDVVYKEDNIKFLVDGTIKLIGLI